MSSTAGAGLPAKRGCLPNYGKGAAASFSFASNSRGPRRRGGPRRNSWSRRKRLRGQHVFDCWQATESKKHFRLWVVGARCFPSTAPAPPRQIRVAAGARLHAMLPVEVDHLVGAVGSQPMTPGPGSIISPRVNPATREGPRPMSIVCHLVCRHRRRASGGTCDRSKSGIRPFLVRVGPSLPSPLPRGRERFRSSMPGPRHRRG